MPCLSNSGRLYKLCEKCSVEKRNFPLFKSGKSPEYTVGIYLKKTSSESKEKTASESENLNNIPYQRSALAHVNIVD